MQLQTSGWFLAQSNRLMTPGEIDISAHPQVRSDLQADIKDDLLHSVNKLHGPSNQLPGLSSPGAMTHSIPRMSEMVTAPWDGPGDCRLRSSVIQSPKGARDEWSPLAGKRRPYPEVGQSGVGQSCEVDQS